MNHGRRAFALAALAAVSAVAGCATSSTPRPALSQLNYTRTFDLVVAAMNDQKLDVDTQDRRHGHIVGTRGGDSISAALHLHVDGTIRVEFAQQGTADSALLQRVIEAYNARLMGAASILQRSTPQ